MLIDIDMFELASRKCPDTIVVAGGYSQGAAVMSAAIGPLDDDVKAQIAGVVL
jgi:cutinase